VVGSVQEGIKIIDDTYKTQDKASIMIDLSHMERVHFSESEDDKIDELTMQASREGLCVREGDERNE
jgi:hypothetical protein